MCLLKIRVGSLLRRQTGTVIAKALSVLRGLLALSLRILPSRRILLAGLLRLRLQRPLLHVLRLFHGFASRVPLHDIVALEKLVALEVGGASSSDRFLLALLGLALRVQAFLILLLELCSLLLIPLLLLPLLVLLLLLLPRVLLFSFLQFLLFLVLLLLVAHGASASLLLAAPSRRGLLAARSSRCI